MYVFMYVCIVYAYRIVITLLCCVLAQAAAAKKEGKVVPVRNTHTVVVENLNLGEGNSLFDLYPLLVFAIMCVCVVCMCAVVLVSKGDNRAFCYLSSYCSGTGSGAGSLLKVGKKVKSDLHTV